MITARLLDIVEHFLIPRSSNNQKARLLHSSYLLMLAGVVISLQLAMSVSAGVTGGKVLGYAANISPSEIVRLTNEKRTQRGINMLTENQALDQAALAKGTDMLNNDYWAHVSPSGTEPWVFFMDAGYEYRYAGENLAKDFSNPGSVVEAWMASPTHKENLLSAKYRDIGVAVVEGEMNGVETTIVVQLFGTQAGVLPAVTTAEAAEHSVEPLEEENTLLIDEETAPVFAQQNQGASYISPFNLTKKISIGVGIGLMIIMVIDMLVVARKKITRVGGRAIAQISFFGMVVAIIIIIKAGEVL